MPQQHIILLGGAGDELEQDGQVASIADGSYNMYADGELLANYPGRDYYYREDVLAGMPTGDMTSIFSFTDILGIERILFVKDGDLCVINGNSYKILYTFIGDERDGLLFPYMFSHQGRAIICNMGDPVMVYDGTSITRLGVAEVPFAPEGKSTAAPYNYEVYGGNILGDPLWNYRNWWWPGRTPISGPMENKTLDGVDDAHGYYKVAIQFVDKYGNRSRVSPSTPLIFCDIWGMPNVPVFIVADWVPPMIDENVVAVIVGRTLNLNSDGGTGVETVFFKEKTIYGTSQSRSTLVLPDETLAAGTIMTDGIAPQSSSFGCSWKARCFFGGGDNKCRIEWSSKTAFGEIEGFYLAKGNVESICPAGDRLLVVTDKSVEVLYELQDGSIATLEIDTNHSSMCGRSIIDIGNGTSIGLYSGGFMIFSGDQGFKALNSPLFISDDYVDTTVSTAVYWQGYYVLACRIKYGQDTFKNNCLLMYNVSTGIWYQIRESTYGICNSEGALLGTDGTIYELFKGAYSSDAIMILRGVRPQKSSIVGTRNVIGIKLLCEASGDGELDIEVLGNSFDNESSEAKMMPSENSASRQSHHMTVWDGVSRYDDLHKWNGHIQYVNSPVMGLSVPGRTHDIKIVVPSGNRFRLKGIVLVTSDEDMLKP